MGMRESYGHRTEQSRAQQGRRDEKWCTGCGKTVQRGGESGLQFA